MQSNLIIDHIGYKGLLIAASIIMLWLLHLGFALPLTWSFHQPLPYLLLLLQTHLFTGLFITAHDAMHGTVFPKNKKINDAIGHISTFLYAFFPYQKLKTEHSKHHKYVHTNQDPDYYKGNFWVWYLQFLKHYISIWQIIGYAITFNGLKLFFSTENLLFFWIIPAILSTFQLFYFGTYRPHKGKHNNHHYARSQNKNHFWAFTTCYFFGYHYEHHDKPYVPWWLLWKIR